MRKAKSLISTLLVSGTIFGVLYFVSIEIERKKSNFPALSKEEELSGLEGDTIIEVTDIAPPVSVEPITPVEEPKLKVESMTEESIPTPMTEINKEPITTKKEVIAKADAEILVREGERQNKQEQKKAEEKRKTEERKLANKGQAQKESKIGIDRKLISGIPGTMKYKGAFPPHNVKERGSITITYTVDPGGSVISAYRSAGLRDRNTVNNAATLVRRYVKAEKGKTNSTGTYIIDFK